MIDDFGAGRRRPVPIDAPRHRKPTGNSTSHQTAISPSGKTSRHPADSDHKPAVDLDEIDSIIAQLDAGPPPKRSASWLGRLTGKLSRTQWLVVASVFLFVVGAGTIAYALLRPDDSPQANAAITPQKAPAPVPPPPPVSPLTGLEVSAEDAKHIVTGVMIENSTFARPQSSLQQAGVVYEAIAEYGITRFLALFQEAKPVNIGPVRSVRPYYVDWAKIYDAPIAHVGGSPDALQKIKAEGVKDLDQFFNSGYYHRIGSREAPHNMYTSMEQLNKAAAAKGWTGSTFTPWQRKKDAGSKASGKPATASKINIAVSGPTYNVHYDYNPETNSYNRVMAGAPHNDADSGTQITPKVVIGLATSYGLEPDGYHSKYATAGSGKAFIFQDGGVTPVTWNRQGNEQYSFSDETGKPVKLNAGQTWITVVGDPAAITYTP